MNALLSIVLGRFHLHISIISQQILVKCNYVISQYEEVYMRREVVPNPSISFYLYQRFELAYDLKLVLRAAVLASLTVSVLCYVP